MLLITLLKLANKYYFKFTYKHLSWFLAVVAFCTQIFGLINVLIFFIALVIFLLGFIIPIYVFGGNTATWQNELNKFIKNFKPNENPLEDIKQLPPGQRLGLNLAGDIKPIILIQPNIKIQTESPKHSQKYQQQQQHHGSGSESYHHKKSFLDSGIELLFKKHGKVTTGIKETLHHHHMKENTVLETASSSGNNNNKSMVNDDKKWKPFETIKMYSERRSKSTSEEKIDKENLQLGEDCASDGNDSSLTGSIPYNYTVTIESEAHLLDEHGSPKKKLKTMLSGNKKIDQLLHTMIDFIIRDFIDSWFCSLSDNKEFGDFRVRNCMEESINNLCTRIKNTQWTPLMTEKIVEKIALHTKFYRLAKQAIQTKNDNSNNEKCQQQRRNTKANSSQQHKRNKSDTDLNWHFTSTSSTSNINQKNVANSKFYTEAAPDEKILTDPEENLLNEFFNQSNLYRKECTDEIELENYLTQITETILYFTLPEEDFTCIPLRTFLSTLLANVVLKSFLKLVSDPDFINLQLTKLIKDQPPPVEYFLKALRQSNDLSELRACRQLITKEMSLKYKDSSSSAEMNSLRYAQKLVDLRLSQLQKPANLIVPDEIDIGDEHISFLKKLPILTLDELLFKELARSYFLDYLSDINLQKYVIFYLTADEWKCLAKHSIVEIQTNRNKIPKEEIYCNLKDKAQNIYQEYLQASSNNCINIDAGLIEALSIKLKNPNIVPESGWFDSICKFVYEKLKNEEIFLTKFYQSTSYKKLLLELEVDGISQNNDSLMDNFSEFSENNLSIGIHSGGEDNSSDTNFDDDMLDLVVSTKKSKPSVKTNLNNNTNILPILDMPKRPDLLDVINFKHSRSHSDCGIPISHFESSDDSPDRTLSTNLLLVESDQHNNGSKPERAKSAPSQRLDIKTQPPQINLEGRQKLVARIINTAILCEGQYAVYAVEVTVIEDNQEKSWHIYRRYSKFLELKKVLIKKFPNVAKLPFPAKKAFQNTQRSVLEHRMVLLNEFLRLLCQWSENNDSLLKHMREFLEPDTDDRKIHGGAVVRTLEAVVNPLKSGMRTIKNMPDTLVGGFSRILLGKGPLREQSLLEINLEQCEYPALNSMIHLLDEVFDLQARSQWLRRGIINRVLGAPWVSHTANKKIIHHAKSLIEVDKIEQILLAILHNIWPDGTHQNKKPHREDNTKLRTRVAAQMSLFALLFDDLKRVVGSETTRHGLLNCFEMWQHEKLNLRLALIILNDVLTEVYKVKSMTAHIYENEN